MFISPILINASNLGQTKIWIETICKYFCYCKLVILFDLYKISQDKPFGSD